MRKQKVVTIPDDPDNRDRGKAFIITEMPATKAERWAMRALLAVAHSGVDIPVELVNGGMQALAIVGIRALTSISFDDAEPLMNEAMTCVKLVPDPIGNPEVHRALIEGDVEEVSTLIMLKREVIDLHLGFSSAGGRSKQTSGTPATSNSRNTSTSQSPSAPSSRPVRRAS